MKRMDWYRTAVRHLGIPALVRLQLQKRFGGKLCKLTSRLLKHPVHARNHTSDMAVFDQIFVEREYRCLDDVRAAGLIIDCGANVGYSSAYFLSRFPGCTVIAIEPDPDNFSMLCDNVSPYGTRCRPILAAVWSAPETLRLSRSSGTAWGVSVEKAERGDVAAVTIPQLLAPGQRISVLKIDIEGAEYELFRAPPIDWLDRVDNMVIELHDTRCEEAFFAAIAGRGFKISTCGELTVCLRQG